MIKSFILILLIIVAGVMFFEILQMKKEKIKIEKELQKQIVDILSEFTKSAQKAGMENNFRLKKSEFEIGGKTFDIPIPK